MTIQEDNKRLVREAFRSWERGNRWPFFDLVADDVDWTVIGNTLVSGRYRSKQALVDKAFGPLLEHLEGPLKTRFIDLAAEADKVFIRFESTGLGRNGVHYDQSCCWAMVMRDGRITEIVAYLDTDLLVRIFADWARDAASGAADGACRRFAGDIHP